MDRTRAFMHASLEDYSSKDRFLIRAADLALYTLIRVIGRTIRFEAEGLHYLSAIERAGKLPIYAFWHDRIFASAWYFRNRGIAVITSKSKDGEYIARAIRRLGFGAIRGSSTRGGVGALVEMIKAMRGGTPTAFTVDGPKGPRYEAKPGPILLAKKTGNPIVPFVIESARFWTIGSWDKLQIPQPFTKARLIMGEPIWVEANANEIDVQTKLHELQVSLDTTVEAGANWRSSM